MMRRPAVTEVVKPTRVNPDYGIDAPGLVRFFWLAGSVVLVLCVMVGIYSRGWPFPGEILTGLSAIASLYLLGMGCFMIYESKVTKIRNRERLLDLNPWRGDEAVLDVGCGRGLMLVGAARRLTTGRACGIDIWRAADQSSNSADSALSNAAHEGVSACGDCRAEQRSCVA